MPPCDPLTARFVRAAPLPDWDDVPITAGLRDRLRGLSRLFHDRSAGQPPLLILEGCPGSGRAAAAAAVCRDADAPLLMIDFDCLRCEMSRPGEEANRLIAALRLLR